MSPVYRPVFCLLGLPFDALSMGEAESRVRLAMSRRERSVLSTPNINWVALARGDAAFRHSVLASDCSVADGMPLIWIARLLGLPFPERVSGSDLIEQIRQTDTPLRVFFFGGQGDVAERAAATLAGQGGGLIPVGALNPGMGSLESMSTPEILQQINTARPDLVIVSLGAQRGQAWIVRNRGALEATWVTHLGAVVNFYAGEVTRSPKWIANGGFEWAWRVLQEPALWKRYWKDGRVLAGLVLTRLLPMLLRQGLGGSGPQGPATLEVELSDVDRVIVRLRGAWTDRHASRLADALAEAQEGRRSVWVDLNGISRLGAGVVGQLLVSSGALGRRGCTLEVRSASPRARRLLFGHCAEFLMEPAT